MVAVNYLGENPYGEYAVQVRGNKRNECGELTRTFKTEAEAQDYATAVKAGYKKERTLERQPEMDTFGFAPKPFNPIEEYAARGKDIVGWAGTGFGPKNDGTADNRPDILKKLFPLVGCDLPEQGGITGKIKIGKKDKPHPIGKEERPSTVDWKTGERVYVDQLPKPYVCYVA